MSNGAAPEISQVLYDPGALTVRWFPMSAPDLTGFRVFWQKAGASDPQHQDTGPDAQFAKVDQDLTDGQYTTWVATLINGAVGAQSDPLPVITVQPDMQQVAYDVSPEIGLTVRWAAVDAEGQTGYVAFLEEVEGTLKTEPTSQLTAFFKQGLNFSRTYNVYVRASGYYDIIMGPSSTVYQPVLDTPMVVNLAYEVLPAAELTLRWSLINDPSVTAYLAILDNETDRTSTSEPTTQAFAVFAGALRESDDYKAYVRATGQGGVAQGPKSSKMVPIVAQAERAALNYTGTGFPFTWSAISYDGLTGYQVQFYEDDVVSDETVQETSVTFIKTLQNGVVYRARVRGVATQVQGPWTALMPGPYGMSTVLSSDALGRIEQIEINNTSTIIYTIDDAGNVTNRTLAAP